MKKITALLVSIVLVIMCFASPVSAAVKDETDERYVITDDELKSSYLASFNQSVNAIKSEMPACKMTTSYSVGDPTIGSSDGEYIDDSAKKWISYIVNACFKDGAGMADTLFTTIFGDPDVPESIEFQSGEKRNKRAPISGTDYVSGLTDDDDFSMTVRTTGSKLHPENNLTTTTVYFSDVTLENAKGSSLNKIFNMTDGEFNPIVASEDADNNIIYGTTFDNFTFTGAYAEAITNTKGELVTYATDITYTFTISLYDFVNLISANTGIDYMAVAMAIADTIIANTGKANFVPDDVLRSKCLYINYNIRTEFTDFDWGGRYFGDIDNSDDESQVTVNDARIALRHAIGLQLIKNQAALIHADVDFDGEITVKDARLILRQAIGLDEVFSEVPEGKKVTIVDVQDEIIIPEEEEDDTDSGTDASGGTSSSEENDVADISPEIESFVQSIFDVISAIKDDEGAAQSGLTDIIEYLKNIKDE